MPNPVEVLTFARLDPVKGIEYAIRGAAQATEFTHRRFRLTVAGVPEEPIYIPVLEQEIRAARRVLPVEFTVFDHIFAPAQRDRFLDRFDLYYSIRPFYRCMICNGIIKGVPEEEVIEELQPLTRKYYHEFFRCTSCKTVYWKGSHYQRMIRYISEIKRRKNSDDV